MNYRMTQEFKPPFRINALIEEAGALKVNTLLFFLKAARYMRDDKNCYFYCYMKFPGLMV